MYRAAIFSAAGSFLELAEQTTQMELTAYIKGFRSAAAHLYPVPPTYWRIPEDVRRMPSRQRDQLTERGVL